jgi:hypothetical protein
MYGQLTGPYGPFPKDGPFRRRGRATRRPKIVLMEDSDFASRADDAQWSRP